MNKVPTEAELQAELEAFTHEMNVCYARMGLAIATVANDTPLIDTAVLGTVQMVVGDMLARVTGDPEMKKKWLDHVEEFQKRHFTA